MSKADDIFYREFGIILGLLAVFGILMFLLARNIGAEAFAESQLGEREVAARIQPVGAVRTGDPGTIVAAASTPAPESAPIQVAAADSGDTGEAVYKKGCFACHATGAANAPKLGDNAQWVKRLEQGLETLVANAINGKGAMPAKGGLADLTDDDIEGAVLYMLTSSGIEP